MNNKSKLVLGLSAMLAATVGVAATGTFAWFTTTRVAQVNVTSATVYSSYGKLAVAYAATQPAQGATAISASGTGTPADPIALSATTNNMTDISGNGNTFYKPTWLPGYEGTSCSAMPTSPNTATNAYYVAFALTFTNSGTASIDVYFDSTTVLKAHDTEGDAATIDANAMKATRVAVWTTQETPTLVSLWQQETDAAGYKYISAATGTAYSTDTTYGGTLTTLTSGTGSFNVGAYTAVKKGFESTAKAGQKLCTLTSTGATATTTLTFTMWLEGTATTAVNTDAVAHNAIGGKVDAEFHFAALEA